MIARKFFDLQRFTKSITNHDPNKTITGSDEVEYIENKGGVVSISAGGGNDTISNGSSANLTTINAGTGNDSIFNYESSNVSINGGNGDDTITNGGVNNKYLTITGGKGNDIIDLPYYSSSSVVEYTYGDGDDTIHDFTSNDTLKIATSVGYSTVYGGNKLYIKFDGSNNIVLTGISESELDKLNIISVSGGGSDNSTENPQTRQATDKKLYNYQPNKILFGSDEVEYIENKGGVVSISAGGGNDTISNGSSANLTTINAGTGNDSIFNYESSNVSINGGNGDDTITNGGVNNKYLTITGGKGNDIIDLPYYSSSSVVEYTYGDGDDTIHDFTSNDTLKIATSVGYSTVYGGNNLYFKFDDSNNIVLTGISESELGKLNIVTVQGGGNSPNPPTSFDFKEALKSILDAVGTWGNVGTATTAKEAISYIETLTKDKKSNDNLLENIFNLATSGVGAFGGIYTIIDNFVVKNSPTNQILQVSKTGKPFDEKIFGEAAKKNIAFVSVIANIFGLASSMSKAGYKLDEKTLHEALNDFADVAENIASSSASIADLKNAINAVEVSKKGPWSAVNIYLALVNGAIGIVKQSAQSFSKYYYDDNKWDFNDTAEFLIDVSLSGLYGISHTLTLGLDDIIWNTLNGWKDTGGKSFPEIAADNIKNFARNLGNQVNVFISNFKEGVEKVIDGFKLAGTILTVLTNNINSVWLGNSADFSDVKTVDGKSNNEDIILAGNSVSNSIVGGNGKNSLWGGASGNNTLTGGTARDQFWYGGSGNDVVTNFSAGNGANNDVVVLFDGALSKVSRSGSNVAFNMSNSRSLNLKTTSSSAEDIIQYSTDGNNIFGAKIGASNTKSLNYDSSVSYFQLNGGGTLNVTNSGANNVWLDGSQGQSFSGIKNIKDTGTGQNILVGNSDSNSIVGGNGNSSLWGGTGNDADTLVGGTGSEMFWYGKNDGADIVNNASSSDIINMYDISLSDFVTADISDKKFSFTFNTGNSLQVTSSESNSATFNLTDGSWKYNHSSKQWQNA